VKLFETKQKAKNAESESESAAQMEVYKQLQKILNKPAETKVIENEFSNTYGEDEFDDDDEVIFERLAKKKGLVTQSELQKMLKQIQEEEEKGVAQRKEVDRIGNIYNDVVSTNPVLRSLQKEEAEYLKELYLNRIGGISSKLSDSALKAEFKEMCKEFDLDVSDVIKTSKIPPTESNFGSSKSNTVPKQVTLDNGMVLDLD
jgi:hypothetical protein